MVMISHYDKPFVPIQTWSCSSLKCSLTFRPYLLVMPDRGEGGRGSWVCLMPGWASSGMPFSIIFLCSLDSLKDSWAVARGERERE